LVAQASHPELISRRSYDRLLGGAEADRFVFNLAVGDLGSDTILDFNLASGDSIVINGQDATATLRYIDRDGDGTRESTLVRLATGNDASAGEITVADALINSRNLIFPEPALPDIGTERAPTPVPDLSTRQLYVSPKGSDGNDGAAGRPFATIQAAADAATPGTTIHVAPGIYRETVYSQVDGTAKAPIRFVSDTPGAAVIKPSGATDALWQNDGDHVTIEGFDLDGSASPDVRLGLYDTASHTYARNNEVHHILQSGANDGQGGGGIVLGGSYYGNADQHAIGNDVHHVGTATSDRISAIYHQSTGSVINNVVHDNPGSVGISLWHDAHDMTIANNTVARNWFGILVGSGDHYQAPVPADHVTVVNNIVSENQYGISEQGSTGRHNVYQNNLVSANTNYNWSLQNGLSPSGTVTANPQFVDKSAGDYHLAATSPAIDAGTATSAAPFDMDGFQRDQHPDVGAYEWFI
jgi:hypothetical protein